MVLQQPDVGIFFGMFAGLHLLFTLYRRHAWQWQKSLATLVPAALVALMIAGPTLLSGYKHNIEDTAQVQTETPEEKWNYITQWSFPPDEMIDLIAPNFMGIRSGEPSGPYWGRTGRSAEWEQTRQGFMNYRVESVYLGFIPIAFAFFALVGCRRSKHYPTVIFWACSAAVALMLSFGRYFPLYRLFYMLPVVNNIRNPNKFLQVFQVCLAILTAYGFQAMFFKANNVVAAATTANHKKPAKRKTTAVTDVPAAHPLWPYIVLGAATITLMLAAMITSAATASISSRFTAQGWPPQAATVIAANQVRALWHAFFMALLTTLACAPFFLSKFARLQRFRTWIAAGLVLVVAADAYALSRHYIKEMPRSYIDANPLTDFLQQNLGTERTTILTQQGIYGIWQNYLLPYHRIPTFSFAAMPRMSTDYQQLLQAGSQNPLRMWQFSSVKYLLAPAALEQQLPPGTASKVFAYNLQRGHGDNFNVVPLPNGEHAVFELAGYAPRYLLLTDGRDDQPSEALQRIASPAGPLLNGTPVPNAVTVQRHTPSLREMRVQAEAPGLLRIAERWDPDWKAWINDKEVPVKRIEHMIQGIEIPAGTHNVRIAYRPSLLFFYMQISGFLILLGAILARVLTRKRDLHKQKQTASECN
jgi:hypothetical protein